MMIFSLWLTLTMFIGPMRLVLKHAWMSSGLVSSRGFVIKIPALLISRLRPPVPTREYTCWAHCFMLERSEVSDGERKKVEQQQSESLINITALLIGSKASVGLDMGAGWRV